MGRTIDIDDLIDSTAVAELVGLARASAISVYRARYDDFPEPVVDQGRCMLWARQDVERWAAETGRRQPRGH